MLGPTSVTAPPEKINATSYAVTGLEHAEYTFDIRAVNNEGEGGEVSVTFTAETVPENFSGYHTVNRQTLNDYPWIGALVICSISSSRTGGSPLTGYEYRVKLSGESWGEWQFNPVDPNTYVYLTITPGTYTIRVRAVNRHGPGEWRQVPNDFTLEAQAPGQPFRPNSTLSARNVSLSWGVPHNEGDRITHMEYSYKKEGESYGSWTQIPDSRQGIPPEEDQENLDSYTITDLPGGRYKFKVRGVNSIGNGGDAESRNYLTIPTELPNQPVSLQAQGSNESVHLTWQAGTVNGPAITKHQYQVKAGTGSYGAWTDIADSAVGGGNELSYTLSSLTNGTLYTFKLRTVNIDGTSEETGEVTATPASTSLPGAPVLRSATAEKNGNVWSVSLAWDAAADNGNAITGYQYSMKTGDGSYGNWVPIAQSAPSETNESSFTIANVTAGNRYSFKLQAVNGNGAGIESNEKSTATVEPPELESITVSSFWLEMTYNKNLDADSRPSGTSFAVSSDSSAHTVDGVYIEGAKVMLQLNSPVKPSDTVTLDYTSGSNPIRETVGLVSAASLNGESVANESLLLSWEGAGLRGREGEDVQLCISLSQTVNRQVRFKISQTGTTTNPAQGADYSDLPQTVTILPQQSRRCFTIGLVDDSEDEANDESFLVKGEALGESITLNGVSVIKKLDSFQIGAREIYITDNDGPPSITTPGPFSVDENTLAVTQLSATAESWGRGPSLGR